MPFFTASANTATYRTPKAAAAHVIQAPAGYLTGALQAAAGRSLGGCCLALRASYTPGHPVLLFSCPPPTKHVHASWRPCRLTVVMSPL